MTEELLTAREVADLLRVKPVTVYSAADRGLIPCVRLWTGRRRSLVRFRREDIEAVIKAGASAPSKGIQRT